MSAKNPHRKIELMDAGANCIASVYGVGDWFGVSP
jgi:hypothetical protein